MTLLDFLAGLEDWGPEGVQPDWPPPLLLFQACCDGSGPGECDKQIGPAAWHAAASRTWSMIMRDGGGVFGSWLNPGVVGDAAGFALRELGAET